MKRYIYCIKDDLSEYKELICDDSDAMAIRGFESVVFNMLLHDDKPTSSLPYIDDLSLYRLGEFDTGSGIVTSSAPDLLSRGKAVRLKIESLYFDKEVNGHEKV